jgi:hypothetical protein
MNISYLSIVNYYISDILIIIGNRKLKEGIKFL